MCSNLFTNKYSLAEFSFSRVLARVLSHERLKLAEKSFMYCSFADILNLGCAGIRIRRYVSNGFCTSRRPIRDTICDGECVAMDELPWFPDYSKIISRHKREWRCVADETRSKKVTVHCNDGTKRRYEVRVVRSCKCKRYTHKQNQTNPWYTVAALFTNNKEQKSTMKNRCQKAYPQRWTANIPSLCSFRM